ncbi:MAG: hypothetical protein OEM76_15760, partial [Gammaproteobacteria bacterium]|nr:hypothetical protein [Gammaproteobacteria bacterium]
MARRIFFTAAFFCLGMPFAGAEENYKDLLDEAIGNIEWEFEKEWAFTETSLSDGGLFVGRFDPRLEDDEQWTLLSVDGKEPTSRQRRKYVHDKDEHRGDSDDDDNRVTAIVEPDSLEMVEETDEHWLFTFVPAEDQEAFMTSVDAKIRIVKDGRYVDSLEMRNFQDIKPGFGTKITRFQMRFTFGRALDAGPIVPKSMDVQVTGRALLFIGFDEIEVT